MSNKSLTIIIVDKQGSLKTLNVKDYKVDDLYKKCGFKKAEGFEMHTEWSVKLDGHRYLVQLYGKLDGKANMENKYDFPPPVDNLLFFGSCALVGMIKDDKNSKTHINLNLDLWNKLYEKLFGGFDDLAVTCADDDDEEDELENVSKKMKTKKGGYLKDGFVVDSSDTEEISGSGSESDDESDNCESWDDGDDDIEEIEIEDIGSELSEESYIESDKE